MIRDNLGRPDRGPLLDYAKALAEVYKGITNNRPGYSTRERPAATKSGSYFEREGPEVRFYHACLTPFTALMSSEGVVALIRSARSE